MRWACVIVWIVPMLAVVSAAAAGSEVPIVEAAKKADAAEMDALLQQGVDVNSAEADGTTALHWAAHLGDLQGVEMLLEAGAVAAAENRYGVMPLSLAAANGSAAVIERLLEAGADPNTTLMGGETALMTAARTGVPEAVEVLLAHGAQVDARDTNRRQTALMWAAEEGYTEAMRLLLEAGADVRARSDERDYRYYASFRPSAIGQVETGVVIEFSPLVFAVRAGKIDAVKLLLDVGADPNETVPDGTSALVIVAINAHWELGAYLLDRGADPNAMVQGWNALHQVARTRTFNLGNVPHPVVTGRLSSLDFAKKLIEHGVDVNALMTKEIFNDGYRFRMRRIGATAFLIAAKGADAPMMRLLAENGANTLVGNEEGTTPLMAVAGVDLSFLGEDTGTHEDAFEAIKVALEYPHDVNAANNAGWTALHGAARRGAIPVVKALIAAGASLDAKTGRDLTPLSVALGRKNGRILFLAEQRQFEAAVVIRQAMYDRGVLIDEDQDALDLLEEAIARNPQLAADAAR